MWKHTFDFVKRISIRNAGFVVLFVIANKKYLLLQRSLTLPEDLTSSSPSATCPSSQCSQTLKSTSILPRDIQVSYMGEHFIIDVKVEENLYN